MARKFVIRSEGLPSIPGLMLATLEALKAIGASASIQELDETIAELENVTEAEQSLMMSNDDPRPRLNYYLAWARTYLRRGGAIENSARGIWTLTETGTNIASLDQVKAIYDQVNSEERARTRERRLSLETKAKPTAAKEPAEVEAPQEQVFEAKNWKEALLSTLKRMEPDAFERLAQRILRESGFVKVEVRGKSGDGGIDGVGVLRVNLVSFQVFFQCKRWKGSVGASEIRDFRGAMQGRADKGLFITTGNFTSQASDEATRDGATAIDLIDGERLCDLLKELKLGVQTEMIENVIISPVWFETL